MEWNKIISYINNDQNNQVYTEVKLVKNMCSGFEHYSKCDKECKETYPFCKKCYQFFFEIKLKRTRTKGIIKLFAHRKGNYKSPVFRKGAFVAPFVGEFIDKKVIYERYLSAIKDQTKKIYCPFLLRLSENLYLDFGMTKYRGIGSYARRGDIYNTVIVQEPFFGLMAIDDIYHGEEIIYPTYPHEGEEFKLEVH